MFSRCTNNEEESPFVVLNNSMPYFTRTEKIKTCKWGEGGWGRSRGWGQGKTYNKDFTIFGFKGTMSRYFDIILKS